LTRFSFDGYRWLRDGIEIDGQTNLTYTPTAADAGHGIQCEMIATDPPPYSVTATAMSASISVWPTPLLRVSRLRVSPRRLLAVGRLRVRYDLTQAATVRFRSSGSRTDGWPGDAATRTPRPESAVRAACGCTRSDALPVAVWPARISS